MIDLPHPAVVYHAIIHRLRAERLPLADRESGLFSASWPVTRAALLNGSLKPLRSLLVDNDGRRRGNTRYITTDGGRRKHSRVTAPLVWMMCCADS